MFLRIILFLNYLHVQFLYLYITSPITINRSKQYYYHTYNVEIGPTTNVYHCISLNQIAFNSCTVYCEWQMNCFYVEANGFRSDSNETCAISHQLCRRTLHSPITRLIIREKSATIVYENRPVNQYGRDVQIFGTCLLVVVRRRGRKSTRAALTTDQCILQRVSGT